MWYTVNTKKGVNIMNRKKEICSCYHVTKGDIADAVADGATSFKDIKKATKAGKPVANVRKK